MLNVITMSVTNKAFMLSVFMLNVVTPNVVALYVYLWTNKLECLSSGKLFLPWLGHQGANVM
jgi:NhaP-type Na+/H+ and K+/H+ antiporter